MEATMIRHRGFFSILLFLASSTLISSLLEAQELALPDEVVVKFKPGTPRLLVHEVNTEIGAFILNRALGDPDLYLVQVRPGLDLDKAINRYQMNPNVVHASKNQLVSYPEFVGDGFDDIAEGSRFFSDGRARRSWAVGQNARCDLLVRRLGIGQDRVVEALFFDRAGAAGSNWTLASFKGFPGRNFEKVRQTIVVATTDASAFSGKNGRIGVGFIGEAGLANRMCPLTGLAYDEHSFETSVIAGVQLDDARPFWHTNPPFTESTFPPIAIADLTQMTISVELTNQDLTLRISNPDTGAEIFKVTEPLPVWNRSGTPTSAFAYYGVTDGTSGALYVRSFSAGPFGWIVAATVNAHGNQIPRQRAPGARRRP